MKIRSVLVFTVFVLLWTNIAPVLGQDSDSAFPVTIEHKFGSITISEEPQRVLSLGYNEQDPLLAVGIKPIAVRYWFGDEDNGIFPWALDEADGLEPPVLNMPFGNLNYEAILALEPDLISAVYTGISQEEYDILSQIAPTIAQSDEYADFGMPWQETTLLIGMAVGRPEAAEAAIADVEATRAELLEQNPQFQGATVAVAYNWGENYGFYTAQDGRGRFFTDLGFVVPDEHNELAGDQFFYSLSEERVDLLDQDLLVFLGLQFFEGGSEAAIEAINTDPLLSQLDVVQDGRVFFVSDEYDAALNFGTVLSLQYVLENMVPEIAEVIPNEDDES